MHLGNLLSGNILLNAVYNAKGREGLSELLNELPFANNAGYIKECRVYFMEIY